MNSEETKEPEEDYDEDYNDDEDFQRCDNCDGHDACLDFGCAIKAGIITPGLPDWMQ